MFLETPVGAEYVVLADPDGYGFCVIREVEVLSVVVAETLEQQADRTQVICTM